MRPTAAAKGVQIRLVIESPGGVVAGDADKFADALRAKYPGLRVIAQDKVDLDRANLTK